MYIVGMLGAAVEAWLDEQRQRVSGGGRHLVIIAGDLGDRKDRHSGRFVNELVAELQGLVHKGAEFIITRGNHDTPINGPCLLGDAIRHSACDVYHKALILWRYAAPALR